MSKFRFIGVMLAAVFAVSLTAVSVASAAVTFLLAGLLNSGGTSLAEKEVETSGELELEDTNVPLLGKARVKCSGILDGLNLGPTEPSHLEVLKVLDLTEPTKVEITNLAGTTLACTNVLNCGTPLVVPLSLPWLIELELMVDGTEEPWVALLSKAGGGTFGWEVECMSLGTTDECTTSENVAQQVNVAGGVEGIFSEAFTLLAELNNATCTLGGAGTGVVIGKGITKLVEAGTITISSLE